MGARCAHVDDHRVDAELLGVLVDEALALVARREEDDRRAGEQPLAQQLPIRAGRSEERLRDLFDVRVVDGRLRVELDLLVGERLREHARRRDELPDDEVARAHAREFGALILGPAALVLVGHVRKRLPARQHRAGRMGGLFELRLRAGAQHAHRRVALAGRLHPVGVGCARVPIRERRPDVPLIEKAHDLP